MRFFAERASVPAAVHLDHGSSLDACRKATDAGFTSVMIDGSHLSIDQNVALARQAAELAKPRGVSVEAEVGECPVEPDPSRRRPLHGANRRRRTASNAQAPSGDARRRRRW